MKPQSTAADNTTTTTYYPFDNLGVLGVRHLTLLDVLPKDRGNDMDTGIHTIDTTHLRTLSHTHTSSLFLSLPLSLSQTYTYIHTYVYTYPIWVNPWWRVYRKDGQPKYSKREERMLLSTSTHVPTYIGTYLARQVYARADQVRNTFLRNAICP